MHRNERGEYSPHTLVDHKRKRYDNAVDVVARLHDPTDQVSNARHLRVLAHVQLDDVPRTPIQPSVEGEFRQHDGVMMILMFYRRRASPKHRYDMIEVEYGGRGTAHGWERSTDQLVYVLGCPLPPYIKEQGREEAGPRFGAPRGVLLPPGVGFPPSK